MGRQDGVHSGKPDIMLLLVTLILVSVGMVMIYSSSFIIAQDRFGDEYHFLKKQIIFGFIGLIIMVVLSKFPYLMWKKAAYLVVIMSIVLLSLLLVPGVGAKVGGATRWLRFGAFSFQVSEAVKIALILFTAYYFTKKAEYVKSFFRIVTVPFSITMIVVVLMLMQPDFGTAVITVAVVMCMYFHCRRKNYSYGGLGRGSASRCLCHSGKGKLPSRTAYGIPQSLERSHRHWISDHSVLHLFRFGAVHSALAWGTVCRNSIIFRSPIRILFFPLLPKREGS